MKSIKRITKVIERNKILTKLSFNSEGTLADEYVDSLYDEAIEVLTKALLNNTTLTSLSLGKI